MSKKNENTIFPISVSTSSIILVSEARSLGVTLDSAHSNPKSRSLVDSEQVRKVATAHQLHCQRCGLITWRDFGGVTQSLLAPLLTCEIMVTVPTLRTLLRGEKDVRTFKVLSARCIRGSDPHPHSSRGLQPRPSLKGSTVRSRDPLGAYDKTVLLGGLVPLRWTSLPCALGPRGPARMPTARIHPRTSSGGHFRLQGSLQVLFSSDCRHSLSGPLG